MKNFLTSLVMILSVTTTFAPQSAQAGIIVQIFEGGNGFIENAGGAFLIGAGLTAVGMTIDLASGEDIPHLGTLLFGFPGALIFAGGILLDVDGSIPTSQLVSHLSKKFPFIDNREVLAELALQTRAKLEGQISGDQRQAFVSFSEEEVKEIFSATDLSEENLQTLVQELK